MAQGFSQTLWDWLREDVFTRKEWYYIPLPCQYGSFHKNWHAAYECGYNISLWGSNSEIYMKVPNGLQLPKSSDSKPRSAFLIRLKRSLYGSKWLLDWEGIYK